MTHESVGVTYTQAERPGAGGRSGMSLRGRLALAVAIGMYGAFLAWPRVGIVGLSDFNQLWYAAHALLTGVGPYAAVGPGRALDIAYPLFYPLPAVLVALPLASLRAAVASMVFSGVSAALLTFALTRVASHRVVAVLSFSFFYAAAISQWSPILIASAVLPGLGFLLVAKPTIGFALWLYRPRWQAAALGTLLLLISVVVRPAWPLEWIQTFGAARHIRAPIASPGGPLILLALLRWRRPEARLLAALACVPQTTLLYEVLPLFLVPASWAQSLVLVISTWVAKIVEITLQPYPTLVDRTRVSATISVALCYLPCLIMVLRRPNDGELPAWLEKGAARLRALLPQTAGN